MNAKKQEPANGKKADTQNARNRLPRIMTSLQHTKTNGNDVTGDTRKEMKKKTHDSAS